jgi:lysophospholipase L1-like esterase
MNLLRHAVRAAGILPLLAFSLTAQPAFPPFADGDRVAFVGDSITHIGKYHVFVADYYHTRFPKRSIAYYNAGIGGDVINLVMKRFEKDILPFHPNRAVIMLGMNDVGETHFTAMPTPAEERSQEMSVSNYCVRLPLLVERLQREKIAVALITPSPYDETAKIAFPVRPGKQASLTKCAEFVRRYGREHNIPVIEFQAPLLEMSREVQEKDPTHSIIGKDRVHPGDEGQLLMASLFLQSQSVPSLVASVSMDAAKGKAHGENCTVSHVAHSADGVSFRYAAKSLPFPVVNGYHTAEELLGFTGKFNRELITVTGLKPGTYSLAIDGADLGSYDSGAFAAGVNIATNFLSPMQVQSAAMARFNDDRAALVLALRDMQWVVFRLEAGGVSPDNIIAARAYLDGKENRPPPTNPRVERYFKQYQDRANIAAEIQKLDEKIRLARVPSAHEVKIRLQ